MCDSVCDGGVVVSPIYAEEEGVEREGGGTVVHWDGPGLSTHS